ncbi:maleylpyruvate isomerase family mycothiol-dependent enzyme [Rhodococcus sp. NPDC058639]|uniref:maleylpyruvate isomerase family mycothiol-dependent enzyme n=1 Tax=Rhodococcus sp. NPDC058639 TaxID=3346570 RepID=UPI0036641943
MDTTAGRHTDAALPLTSVVSFLGPEAWDSASPCEGWTAKDVLNHIIGSQREFFADHGFDLGEQASLDDPSRAWREHTARVADIVADKAAMDTAFDGYYGPATIGDEFDLFYTWDMIVHRWDIATAAGLDDTFTDTELDRVEAGADVFGDELYLDGVCVAGVRAPAGADRATRVLARLGRRRRDAA